MRICRCFALARKPPLPETGDNYLTCPTETGIIRLRPRSSRFARRLAAVQYPRSRPGRQHVIWKGTPVTMTPGRLRNVRWSLRAICSYKIRCHQCSSMTSGTATVSVRSGRVRVQYEVVRAPGKSPRRSPHRPALTDIESPDLIPEQRTLDLRARCSRSCAHRRHIKAALCRRRVARRAAVTELLRTETHLPPPFPMLWVPRSVSRSGLEPAHGTQRTGAARRDLEDEAV